MSFDLTKFKFLAFDIYATLIDWETGISKQLAPLLDRLEPLSPLRQKTPAEQKAFFLRRFAEEELSIQTAAPDKIYTAVLSEVYVRICDELHIDATEEESRAFGAGIGDWEAFPDTVVAMQTLSKYYKLAPLSNVDRASFNRTLAGPLAGVHFDAIYVAEDIGSYKPDLRNFHYLIDHVKDEFGIEKMEICQVAQSLGHDHVPAQLMGMSPSVWISRGGGSAMGSADLGKWGGQVNLGATFDTLGEFAEAVKKAFVNPR